MRGRIDQSLGGRARRTKCKCESAEWAAVVRDITVDGARHYRTCLQSRPLAAETGASNRTIGYYGPDLAAAVHYYSAVQGQRTATTQRRGAIAATGNQIGPRESASERTPGDLPSLAEVIAGAKCCGRPHDGKQQHDCGQEDRGNKCSLVHYTPS